MRITGTDVQTAIAHVNDMMKGMGHDYHYEYAARNGMHAVEVYKGTRNLFTAGIGTAREAIAALNNDAIERIYSAACDRLRESAAEFNDVNALGPK